MTIDIKKTWFEANWNKPRKIKRHIKRYGKKTKNVHGIIFTSERYKIELPVALKNTITDKWSFYYKQRDKLQYIMNAYLNGDMNKDNYKQIIDDVFQGKPIWRKARPDGYPKDQPLEPVLPAKKETILGKIIHKIIG